MPILYQLFFKDEYDSLVELGWYENLLKVRNKLDEICKVYDENATFSIERLDYINEMSTMFSISMEFVTAEMKGCKVFGFIHSFQDDEYAYAKRIFVG